ncbi:thiol:disulfide interchange protein DsbG [Robbsia sp. KACC 23696]|uniref:thiol:disulfide interchange protein DsbG n=1 Tax=Robbsia sp. KACC 23696 TaxID=3149231 RepID=UPI00325BFBD7
MTSFVSFPRRPTRLSAMKKRAAACLSAAALLSGVAHAAPAPAANATSTDHAALPPALQTAIDRNSLKLIKVFPAAGGLTGYVVSQGPGKNVVVYSTDSHQVLITGQLIDAQGKDLSAGYAAQYGVKLNLDQFGKAVEDAPAVVEGAQGGAHPVKSTVYVFMDPNCIFCHLTWKALQPYEQAGLQVRWIVMGFLKPDSFGKAAALMQAKDGAAALKKLETDYSEQDEEAGITPLAQVPSDIKAKLDGNFALFQQLGFEGTPTLMMKDAAGHWSKIEGMPKLSDLPQALHLPEQSITDPELQRFR